MIRPVRISHLIVVLLLLLVSAVLERVYDLGIDFLIIFELLVWGYVVYHYPVKYKDKSPFRNNVVNSGRCYSYKVLLRVGSNYLVAFERIHWNKPGFQTKKFAFLFAKSLAGFLNVKLDVSEAIET